MNSSTMKKNKKTTLAMSQKLIKFVIWKEVSLIDNYNKHKLH